MEVVVENKNAGNGVELESKESDPLKTPKEKDPDKKPEKKSSLKAFFTYPKNSKKSQNETEEFDPEDPGPSVSLSDSEGPTNDKKGKGRRKRGKDVLGIWAHRARLTPKRGLIYLIFSGGLVLFLLFVLILLIALWPRGHDYQSCKSSECFGISGKVLSGLNQSLGPCDNFWEYGCGGWLRAHPLPKSKAYWDVSAHHQYQVKDKLRIMLNTLPILSKDDEDIYGVAVKMKRFYDSCMNLDEITNDGDKVLIRIIKSLGGWNVLRDFRASDFHFPRLLMKVQGEYNVSPFFQISVVPHPDVPSRNIIKIVPSGLSLPHPSYYFEAKNPMGSAFQGFAKEVAQNLGATSYHAQQFSIEIFNFERRIAEVTPDPRNASDPVLTLQKLNVGELKSMSNSIFWGDLLKALFPQGNINDQTEVLTSSVQYLMDISSIVSTTDKGNLNNYLIWHLTLKFLPYLSKQYTEIVEMFRRESLGSSENFPRWEFCISETIHFFPHVSDYLLSQQSRTSSSKIEAVTDMFERIRQSAIDRVASGAKYEDSVRSYLVDKLRLMSLQVGSPFRGTKVNDTNFALREHYLSLQIQKYEFFTNVLSLTEFMQNGDQKDYKNPKKDNGLDRAAAEGPFNIQFIPSLNKLIVPQSVLDNELLDVPSELFPLMYGSVGVEIGEAIVRSFGPLQGLYLENGALMSKRDPKVEEMKEMINSRRTCLSSFFTNIRLDDEPYIESTSLDTTLHLGGIQLALDALKNHEVYGSFQSIPGLDYSPEALFFIAYGQSQCSEQTNLFHDLEHTTFTSLSHDHRVRGTLRQLVSFSEAFNCPKSSEMYADFTCGNII